MKKNNKSNNIEKIRHSLAHLLAMAVLEMFPKAKLGIGPVIENGFYYDFDLPESLTPDKLPKLEKNIKQLIKQNIKFTKKRLNATGARKSFKGQPYKLELIKELGKNISTYTSDNFTDLCKGPHIKSTREINAGALKLTRIAGAYWRGDEKNKMLTRIYGVAFNSEKELNDYLKLQKEIEKRDHRKIGKALELFTFSDEIGKGLPLWQPKGTVIRDELEKWAREVEKKEGYVRVVTPHITKGKLYEISGHLPYYADDMYAPFEIEGDKYYLKPMNCPHHHMIYKSIPRSWRDLPLRIAEYGTDYRYERSGTLYGLMRVRGFSMNDAHIYCAMKQAKEEFIRVMKMHEFYYKKLGIKDFLYGISSSRS